MLARDILIVDNDQTGQQQLADYFKNSGYQVATSGSAAYAIAQIARGNAPIVILGDSFEEKISPVDVIALLRKCNRSLCIILVSDDSSLESLRKIRADGIFYHALRPVCAEDNEELRSVVDCAAHAFNPVAC